MAKIIRNYFALAALLFLLPAAPSLAIYPDILNIPHPTAITADELHKMINDGANFTLIDARPDKSFREGHIPGAISMPAEDVNAETLAIQADNMDKRLVFYCTGLNGSASHIGAAKAIGAGYKYVYEYSGGVTGWKEHGFNVTKAQLK